MGRILVLGGDGYLGWPTAMRLSGEGHDVWVVDNGAKRDWERELGVSPLMPIASLSDRVTGWMRLTGKAMSLVEGDLTDYPFVEHLVRMVLPDTVIHYAEQPSAPYSMRNRNSAVFTQMNNVAGTLNLIFAIYEHCPESHIIKLGTMGEYGTPNIDIEEGYLTVSHNGRTDTLPYPKQPPSFYHLSKVHDSHNLMFAARTWGLRVTDLNQGVVYGVSTEESRLDKEFATSFHYDGTFGTVINRFMAQALAQIPLTLYGRGTQQRSFLHIEDTLQCVGIAIANPANKGEFRVFNQFTEQFQLSSLATLTRQAANSLELDVEIAHVNNPRVEQEVHYYHAVNTSLVALGLKPRRLTSGRIADMMQELVPYKDRIDPDVIAPSATWNKQLAGKIIDAAATGGQS